VGSNPTSSDPIILVHKLTMFFHIKASSKDKKILKKFSWFLSKLETSTFTLKCLSKQKKKKVITILKSPHINKTAQEQFEFRFYNKRFLINSFQPLTFLSTLKQIKNQSFSGLNLEVKSSLKYNEKNRNFSKLISPDNFTLNTKHDFSKRKSTNKPSAQTLLLKKYIQSFDCHGEIFLKNIVYFSRNKLPSKF
jgi:ribosomal protein S10